MNPKTSKTEEYFDNGYSFPPKAQHRPTAHDQFGIAYVGQAVDLRELLSTAEHRGYERGLAAGAKRVLGRKCSCGKPATCQTSKGVYNMELNGLPVNDGLWCDKCWDEGRKIEDEAMYG